jgi:DNA ligase-1
MIADCWEDSLFAFVVTQALDPFINFGIAKMPKVNACTAGGIFDRGTVSLLSKLQNRELTGNAAKSAIINQLSQLSEKSQDLLGRIITGKLKGGFSESSVNKAVPNAIYTFKAMLSHKLSDRFGKKDFLLPMKTGEGLLEPWSAELKEDGVRGFGRSEVNGKFCSRSGKPLNAGEKLESQVMIMFALWNDSDDTPLVVDGELEEIGGVFNDTVGAVHRSDSNDMMGLKVIDVITQAELDDGLCPIEYKVRRLRLEMFFSAHGHKFTRIKLVKRWPIDSVEEAMRLFGELHAGGEEGIIVKRPDGFWEGKRSTAWLKVKGEESVDLVVKRLELGDEGREFEHCLGRAICDYNGSKGTVEVAVGGGFSVAQREYYWANPNEIVGHLIKVEYHEETQDGSLRHPRFDGIRDDKPISDGQGV